MSKLTSTAQGLAIMSASTSAYELGKSTIHVFYLKVPALFQAQLQKKELVQIKKNQYRLSSADNLKKCLLPGGIFEASFFPIDAKWKFNILVCSSGL